MTLLHSATAEVKCRGPLGQISLVKCLKPWLWWKLTETLGLKWPIKQAIPSIGFGAVYHPHCQTPLWPLSSALAALATVWKQTERSRCPAKSVKKQTFVDKKREAWLYLYNTTVFDNLSQQFLILSVILFLLQFRSMLKNAVGRTTNYN